MANPFTDLSRDARLAVNLPGFMEKLRAPEVLHALVMATKPDHVSLPDHVLVTLLNDAIDTLQSRRDFCGIHSLLGTLFCDGGTNGSSLVTDGTASDTGHQERQKPIQLRLKTAMVAVGKR